MVNGNRWGVAAVVAALVLGPPALAQSSGTGSGQGSSGSSTSMGSGTGTGSTTSTGSGSSKVDKGLTEAMQKLHADNEAEIMMGQMAQQMGTSQEVKDYGRKLASDHQKNDDTLTALAASLSVDLNGKAYQDEQRSAEKNMHKLHATSGADFDRTFMSMMVKDHEADVKDVQKASEEARTANQPELASYLAATNKGLTRHLQAAERIEQDLKSGKGTASSSTGSAGSMGTGSGENPNPSGGGISPRGGSGGSSTGSSEPPNPSGGAIGPGGGSGGETNPSK